MIILIAPEEDVPNEIEILQQLFQEGLEYFHLRKPNKNYEEHCDYLNKIDAQYHNRIVVHFFHELVNAYPIKGIHFQEKKRIENIDNPGQYFLNLSMFGKTISSSFHDPKVLEECDFEFDYHLLSPVFSSISKQGYEGKGFNVSAIDKLVIGMGGVTPNNLSEFDALGYKGVGVLGGIWQSKEPVAVFNKMKSHFEK